MPIYPYRCEACGETFEVWAKMDDPPPEACEKCGGGPVSRAVARTAFRLKGGGWYAQGYAGGSGGGSSGSKSEGGSSSKSDASSGGGSDGGSSGSGSSGGGSSGGSSDSTTSSS